MEQAQRRKLEIEQQKRDRRKEANARRDKINGQYDYMFLLFLVFLIAFGLVLLYSTSYYSAQVKFGDDMHYLKRQAFFSVVAFLIMLVVGLIDYHVMTGLSKILLAISWIMMALVRFTPLGIEVYGARRWLSVPLIGQMQPSEVTKIAIILFGPYLIYRYGKKINTWGGVIKIALWTVATAAATFILTDHLSGAVIILGIAYIVVLVASNKSRPLGILGGAAIVGAFLFARLLPLIAGEDANFRFQRILVWNDPEKYMSDGGYQILQGLYAIGSGGFFGKGLGNSSQKLGFIPEAQNDMILTILCEELGVFGIIMLLVLFGLLLYRILFIARNAIDRTGALVATGVFAHIALQLVLNICVIINFIPTTGITVPFISYGGSAIVFLLMEMGIVLSVSRETSKKIAEEEQALLEPEEDYV